MHHMKFPPSTDLWVCKHQYSYPDICPECKEERAMELPGVTVYVWAGTMEGAIAKLARGTCYSSKKEANEYGPRKRNVEQDIVERDLSLWEIIIRRESNVKV